MEFSKKEESTYDVLVNPPQLKQLKYEMCRPKRKGKKVQVGEVQVGGGWWCREGALDLQVLLGTVWLKE